MAELFANNASTTLASAAASGDGTISVASAAAFPSGPQFRLRVEDAPVGSGSNLELMLVTAISGTTFTTSRGQEGTSAVAHGAGSVVTQVITAGSLGGQTDAAVATPSLRSLGTGANQAAPGPSAQQDEIQAGVVGSGDLVLTVNSTSQVTMAAGVCWVQAGGFLQRVREASSTVIGSIPAAANNRLDQVVVDQADGTVKRLAGTTDATGVSLANRTGAAALSSTQQLLHDMLVTSGGVTVGNVRDRRPWARGASWRQIRTSGSYTTTSGVYAAVDATNLYPRIECSGVLLTLTVMGQFASTVAQGGAAIFSPIVDGAQPDGLSGDWFVSDEPLSNASMPFTVVFPLIPSAGSHQFGLQFRTASGTLTLFAAAANPLVLWVREHVVQNANNGTS